MSKFRIVPESEVPDPSAFGGVRNPLDEEFADFCEEHPGKWVEFPLEDRYPHLWDGTKDGWKKCCTRVATAITNGRGKGSKKPMGSFVTEDGKFSTRRDSSRLKMYVKFEYYHGGGPAMQLTVNNA